MSAAGTLRAQWWAHPSTQLDDLLLCWCRQHRPDFFPLLLVMAAEGREQVDINAEQLLYIPGSSARSCLLWAEARCTAAHYRRCLKFYCAYAGIHMAHQR